MRWVWIGAVFGVAWLAQASQAEACSCDGDCEGFLLPAGGEVPANLPALLSVNYGQSVSARLVADDGEVMELVPETLQSVPGLNDPTLEFGWWTLYRLPAPLREGRSYEWTLDGDQARENCKAKPEGNQPTLGVNAPVTFTATAPQPFPTSAGALAVVDAPSMGELVLERGGCDVNVIASEATVRLTADPSWEPWRAVMYEASQVGGEAWRPLHTACTQRQAWSWVGKGQERIYAVCEAEPSARLPLDDIIDATPGDHAVEMGLWLPGMEAVLWSQPTTLSLTCDDATSDTNSNNPTTDDANEDDATTADPADGCQQAHGRGGSAWGILGVLALALRGWRRPRR